MSESPYAVTQQFERALQAYTGAPYAVALNSGTAALVLCVLWQTEWQWKTSKFIGLLNYVIRPMLEIPRKTYSSVPMAIIHGGARPRWRDEEWHGVYQLRPSPIWDCARRMTSGMYAPGQYQCVSFATNKILGVEQGGAILHDNAEFDQWARRMRFDGRTEGVDPREDTFDLVGHHCIMLPSIAAQLILKLHHLPKVNADLPDFDYPDLSRAPAFR